MNMKRITALLLLFVLTQATAQTKTVAADQPSEQIHCRSHEEDDARRKTTQTRRAPGEMNRAGIQFRYREKIREGKVGGLFNIKSLAKIREVQKVAV